MKNCYLVFVLIGCSLAISTIQPNDLYNQVQKSSWGKIAIALSQITHQSDGSMKELQDVISSVVNNVEDNLHDVGFAYDHKKSAYSSRSQKLELEIDEAVTFIASNTQYIEEVVKNYAATINKRLSNLEVSVQENKKQVDYLTIMRKKQNEQFLDKLNTYEHMIAQVDMCLALLNGIYTNGDLIQVDRIKSITKNIVGQIGIGTDPQNLLQSTMKGDYNNKQIIKELVQQFDILRKQLVDNQTDSIAYDNEQQLKFEADLRQLNSELLLFKRDIAENIYQLSLTEERERQTKEALEQKNKDLINFRQETDLIKDGDALEDNWNAKIKEEYSNQLLMCQQAEQLIKSSEFQVRMDKIM